MDRSHEMTQAGTADNETRYASGDEAREAVIDLERQGVDADRIQIDASDEVARPDTDTTKRFVGRGALGALVGALIGGGGGLLAALLIGVDPQPAAPLGVMAGLAALGAVIGAFFGAVSKLPVTEGAAELGADPGEVAISVDPEPPAP